MESENNANSYIHITIFKWAEDKWSPPWCCETYLFNFHHSKIMLNTQSE